MLKSLINSFKVAKIKLNVVTYSIKECATIDNIKKFKLANTIDIYHCIYGTYIDYIYWNYSYLLHPIDKLQLEFRHKVMRKECYDNGTCIKCGCTTTALQGAKKSCKGNCYPKWINRNKFVKEFVLVSYIKSENSEQLICKYKLKDEIVKMYKQKVINLEKYV